MHRTGEGAYHRGEKKGAQKILKILRIFLQKKLSFKTTHLMFTARGERRKPAGQSFPWIHHAIRGHVECSLLDREIDSTVVEHGYDST